jgi:hypothetical protein
MSKKICILPMAQATQLERKAIVPRCRWHHHCSEAKALELHRAGHARIVQPASACKHAKPAIVLVLEKDYRTVPTYLGTTICGAPRLRTWQLTR